MWALSRGRNCNCNDSCFYNETLVFILFPVLWYCYLLVVALIDPSSLLLLFLSCLLQVFLSLYLVGLFGYFLFYFVICLLLLVLLSSLWLSWLLSSFSHVLKLQPVDLLMSFFLLFVPLYSSLICVLDFESFTMHTWNNRFFIWEKLHRGCRSHQTTAELVDFVVAGCQEAASLSKERFSVLDI